MILIGFRTTISCRPNSKLSFTYLPPFPTSFANGMFNRFYNAHETTAVSEFAIALLCGDVRCDFYAGVITLDGNRARFAVSDWKTMLVIKTMRTRLREIMTQSFKSPGKPLSELQAQWLESWQRIFSQEGLLIQKGYLKV